LALLLLGLLALLGLAAADEYGMMYDAGSSETRLWLFTWPERTNTSSAPAVTNVVSITTNASASFSFSPRKSLSCASVLHPGSACQLRF
jgi:hypothetical protein